MEVSAPAAQTPPTNGTTTVLPSIEPERILDHLAELCKATLGSSREDLEQSGSLLHKSRHSETLSRCTRFANDAQTVLYIQKDIAHSSAVENGTDIAGRCGSTYVASSITFSNPRLTPLNSAVVLRLYPFNRLHFFFGHVRNTHS